MVGRGRGRERATHLRHSERLMNARASRQACLPRAPGPPVSHSLSLFPSVSLSLCLSPLSDSLPFCVSMAPPQCAARALSSLVVLRPRPS